MNILKKVFVFFCLTICFCGFSVSAASAEAYDIRNFDIDIVVNENNSFEITNTINTYFNESRHGMYYYIPYRGTVTRQINGEAVSKNYRAKITNVKVKGYDYTTSYENGNLVIMIGNEDVYVNGKQNYIISYKYSLYDDEIDSFDDIYLNLFPLERDIEIQNASINIHMPKQFNQEKIEFIGGLYGSVDTEIASWTVDNLKIFARTNRALMPYEGVTLKIILDEGYFTGENTIGAHLVLMLLMIGIIPIINLLLWMRFGRDKKIVKTVEFYPPEGINSAEIGYIIDGYVDSKDIVSLIIYWANEGHIIIEQGGDKDFTLIKRSELSSKAKTYELTMFNGIFKNGDSVKLSELKGTFFDTYKAALTQLISYFNKNKETRLFTTGSKVARGISLFLMGIPLLTLGIVGTYTLILPEYMYVLSVGCALFVIAFFGVLLIGYDKRYSSTRKEKFIMLIIPGVLGGLFLAGEVAFALFALGNIIFGLWAVIASLTSLFLAMHMNKRTDKSIEWIGKILGFKDFIRTAELDRIKLLVEEDPSYFYNVLSYAYVFGLTSQWAKKFESITIEPPNWYKMDYGHENFNMFIFLGSFRHFSKDMVHNIGIPAPSSGGGSGAFSSGGGFSGGGFGGGGMGSW